MPKFENMECVFCKYPLVHVVIDGGGSSCHCDNCGSSGPLCLTPRTAKTRWNKAIKK